MKGDTGFSTRTLRRLLWAPAALIALYVTMSWPGWRAEAAQAAGLGARIMCACRYAQGRELGQCRADLAGIPWMALVRYAEESQARRITASIPLMATRTARHMEGFGCLAGR
jgi:hypothetical protein